MATLTPAAIAGYARQAGFKDLQIVTATAVALAESGGRTDATNRNTNGTTDRGLWQLNDGAHPWVSSINWADPAANAAGAKRIYDEAGGSWKPWVTYNSGSYQRHLGEASQGAQRPTTPDGTQVWLPGMPSNPLDGLGDAAGAAKDGVLLAAKVGEWVSNPHNWLRVVYVVAGGGLIIAGMQLTVSGKVNKVAAPVVGVARKVATKGKA